MVQEFKPKLGRVGGHKNLSEQSFQRQVLNVAYKHGFGKRKRSSFTGSRIGRGSAIGTLAGAGLFAGGQRRVIVKARIAMLRTGDLSAPRAHLRYLQRDGVTPRGEPGQLYDRSSEEVDGKAFLESCDGDRHQFRLIVSPEDAVDLQDLKLFVRDLMLRMESDLDTKLDWVAVDHYNTEHPHSHINIRGKDDLGKDLIMARDYVSHGIRERAMQLVTRELGPEDEFQQVLKLAREVDAYRFTRLDKALLGHADQGLLVISAMPPTDTATHAAHMGRLRKLKNMGLARELQTGVWELQSDSEPKLRALGQRNDIIKTMHRALREAGIERLSGSFTIHDAVKDPRQLVGRVAALGLTDELTDRTYAVIDSLDGKVIYVDLGNHKPHTLPQKGMIVSLESQINEDGKPKSTQMRVLSYLNLEQLTDAQGATWLDSELVKPSDGARRDQGFGAEVNKALTQRRQWLAAQSLGKLLEDGSFQPTPNMLTELKQRDIRRTIIQLAKELQLDPNITAQGEQVSGTYRQSVNLASGKYAVIQKSKEFTLVPWRPELEKFRGQDIAGTIGIHDRFETIGRRTRGLEI